MRASVLLRLTGLLVAAGLLTGCNQDSSSGVDTTTTSVERFGVETQLTVSVVLADGSRRQATIDCQGDVQGTGYLAEVRYAGPACSTIMISAPVVNFLRAKAESHFDPRSRCDVIVESAKPIDDPGTRGRAEIEGTYHGFRTRRTVDGSGSDPCGQALWKLMQPLFTPSEKEIIANYPKGYDPFA
jgi:hypothetical protein